MINKIAIPLMLFFAVFAMSACNSGEKFTEELDISTDIAADDPVPAEGGVRTLDITTNAIWKIEQQYPEWCAIDTLEGYKSRRVTITIQKNIAKERTDTVRFRTDLFYKEYYITQQGVVPTLTVSPESLDNVDYLRNEISLDITTNTTWRIYGLPEWCSVSATTGTEDATVVLTVEENTGGEREGTFTVEALTEKVYVTIKQRRGAAFSPFLELGFANSGQDPLPANGGEVLVNVRSNTEWEVIDYPDWFDDVNPMDGAGNMQLSVSVTRNTGAGRSGILKVKAYENEQTIVVRQLPADGFSHALEVAPADPSQLPVSVGGGDVLINVTSDSDWWISAAPKWCSVEVSEGNGDAQITVTAEPNDAEARTGTLTFRTYGVEKTVDLTQDGV